MRKTEEIRERLTKLYPRTAEDSQQSWVLQLLTKKLEIEMLLDIRDILEKIFTEFKDLNVALAEKLDRERS